MLPSQLQCRPGFARPLVLVLLYAAITVFVVLPIAFMVWLFVGLASLPEDHCGEDPNEVNCTVVPSHGIRAWDGSSWDLCSTDPNRPSELKGADLRRADWH